MESEYLMRIVRIYLDRRVTEFPCCKIYSKILKLSSVTLYYSLVRKARRRTPTEVLKAYTKSHTANSHPSKTTSLAPRLT